MAELDKENEESLIALTTHFAQVQFRLKQIISAEPQHKESLLQDLGEFAFQGCKPMTYDTAASGEFTSTEAQRKMRSTLIEKLQIQLTEIEKCAQEATTEEEGSEVKAAANSMAEKQKIIIEELRKRFDLHFGDLNELSTEEVKQHVERAMNDVVDPIKSKEEYVSQLQSQIEDLERYISFLQDAHPVKPPPSTKQGSGLPLPRSHDIDTGIHVPHHRSRDSKSSKKRSHDTHSKSQDNATSSDSGIKSHYPQREDIKRVAFAESARNNETTPTAPIDVIGPFLRHGNQAVPDYRLTLTQLDGADCSVDASRSEWGQEGSLGEPLQGSKGADDLRLSLLVMRKTLAVMQLLTLCQCGGSVQCLPRTLKELGHRNYQKALHTLEEAVDKIAVVTAALSERGLPVDTRISLETDLHEAVSMTMADSLRVILEHGLLDDGRPLTLSGGCFPVWRNYGSKRGKKRLGEDCPAWKVFKHYYKIKNGKQYSNKTDQLLASSFAIPMETAMSMKKTLLSSIHRVEGTYQGCHHRAQDTKFRALVCEGFNVCHLAEWFRILATQPSVGDDLYSVTSCLATTGLRPAIGCLERLKDNPTGHNVDLPRAYYKCPEAYQPRAI